MKRKGKWRRRIFWPLAAVAAAAVIAVSSMPSPLKVETARAERGPLRVTVDEDGETRAHDRYSVAAPVAGRLSRVDLRDGDRVTRGQVVAVLHPLPLDQRQKEEAEARLRVAETGKREADQRVEQARVEFEQQLRDRQRAEELIKDGYISAQAVELRRNAEATSRHELEAARLKVQAAVDDVEVARAALLAVDARRGESERVVSVRSPVGGRVLRVLEQSERVVAAGTPLLTLGDRSHLEVVIDVLSTDAVKVRAGAPVLLEGWGGAQPIRARVRTVEPYGFTKVSALGVEEQRVNVIADFVEPPGPLGDGYRVEGRIVIWEEADVLRIPSSALFRSGQKWCVFVIEDGKARRREIEVGHRAAYDVEVLTGLAEGAAIVLHPPNQLSDGTRVAAMPPNAR